MQRVVDRDVVGGEEQLETIHLYVVREKEKRPYTALPLFCAFLCLFGIAALTLYSAQHPYYQRERLTVPAMFLPLKVFKAEAPIIPTGVKTYPATYAHGYLTFSNSSVIGQSIPQGFIIDGAATDYPAFIPPATTTSFGMSTVSAHLAKAGIDLSTLSINEVIGSSLFIRNLSPFIGGKAAYSVTYVTAQDKQQTLDKARELLALVVARLHYAYLISSKQVLSVNKRVLSMSWRCIFATYKVPSYMHVLGATLAGRDFLVTVEFIPHPQHIWVK